MKFWKKNFGITLIALVVTIIVLLILAGVSVSMLTGQNGILNRAAESKEKTEIANKDEQRKLAQAEALMNTEKTTYKGVTLPEGFAPTKIEGEDSIDDGLVITDRYGNEYVWIEVPKTEEVYPTAGLSVTAFTDEEYTQIRTDLKEYTRDYKNDDYKDTNIDGTTYSEDYKKMLKSMYINGGFWIGRYEAGYEIDENKGEKARFYGEDYNTEHPITQKVVIKKNAYPYNYVRRDQAQELATEMNYTGCTSSLIYGIQWDLLLKYIEKKNPSQKSNLIDSKKIGNYNNNLWNITNTNAKYSTNSGSEFTVCPYQKKSIEGVLLTIGANENFSLMNMYDLAGNLWEWTLEYYNASNPCTDRGGSYVCNGSDYPATCRLYSTNNGSYYDVGFRVGLWD